MKRIAAIGLLLILGATTSKAIVLNGAPQVVNYQGRLTDASGTPVADGAHNVTFRIWDDSSSTNPVHQLWTSGIVSVTTDKGLFSVKLGTPPQPGLSYLSFYDSSIFLGITVGADPEIAPRTRLTSVPFAMTAENAVSASTAGTAYSLVPASMPAAGTVNVILSSTNSTSVTKLGQFTVTAPGSGVLQINVSGMMWLDADASSANAVTTFFYLGLCTTPGSDLTCNGTFNDHWVQDADNFDASNPTPAFSINGTFPVFAPGPYTFYINGSTSNPAYNLNPWGATTANVLFVPNTLTVTSPAASTPPPTRQK